MSEEQPVGIVKAYHGGTPTLLLTIPRLAVKLLKIEAGQQYLVKRDPKGRLIYEPISG